MLSSIHLGFIFLYSKILTTSKVRHKKILRCFGIGVLVVLLWATLEAYHGDRNTRFYGTTAQNDIPVYETSELDSIFRPRRKHSVWTRQETWQQLQRSQKKKKEERGKEVRHIYLTFKKVLVWGVEKVGTYVILIQCYTDLGSSGEEETLSFVNTYKHRLEIRLSHFCIML